MGKIIMIIGSILLCFGIGMIVPKFLSNEVQGIELDQAKLYLEVQQQFVADLALNGAKVKTVTDKNYAFYATVAEANQDMVNLESDTVVVIDPTVKGSAAEDAVAVINEIQTIETSDPGTVLNPDGSEVSFYDLNGLPLGAEATTETITDTTEATTDTSSEQVVKDGWVQAQIDQNADKIDGADLSTGAAIYNKLDTNYLFGLANDGLTEDEKAEVKTYLEANLSPSEIETAMQLYYKYVDLLN